MKELKHCKRICLSHKCHAGLYRSMDGARLHKTSRRDAMAQDPRRDVEDLSEMRRQYVSRRLDRDHIPG